MISSCWAASRARAWAAEVGQFFDHLLRLGQPFPELGGLCLEPGDLSLARVGDLAGILQCLDPSFELDAEVSVRASAVERGAVDAGLVGESLDVALSAGRHLSSEEPVHGGPDAVLVLGPLGCGDSHADSSSVVLAASISATTRRARS
jgi:hypothetical protein